ncbi:hypothetical protein AB0D60_34855 [Streptomyces sp. NPDC048306]|uniref:hypothetical protein n=1 Tax=Streptomyces sp. NPDC048306 TaxID=3154502 RepID=UPI0033EE5558
MEKRHPMIAFNEALPGQQFTLAGTAPEGFDTLYGIPAIALGEECDRLMALGHITDRAVLAVTNAYQRRVWGHRVLPGSTLTDLIRSGTRRINIKVTRGGEADTHDEDEYAWYFQDAEPDDSTAQSATVIDIEWLDREDVAVQSECPACGRASRSTTLTAGPGRAGWGRYHRCRSCGHAWPAVPVRHLSLTKHRRWSPTSPDGCFACNCQPGYPCTADCAIWFNPLIGQRLCATCRDRHATGAWQQLAAVSYGTISVLDDLDAQRDRWLYSETLRGVPPVQAAQTWQHRVALTIHRAAMRPNPTRA